MRNGGDKAVTLTFHHDIKRDGESLARWIKWMLLSKSVKQVTQNTYVYEPD